ncbi:MAG: response regulator [Anaerolineae bacterium]|uniref:response regulator n=1 Tax=Candidatus Flexifilum breve TaxID=3140694 RepID=UPI001AC9C5AD|nr:response regulator [Chloroflexota bacterium]MBK9745151.1 response regulator [Chloroflexota bacterium]MBN8636529.1 response regulator [Anaerolineae bacterium]
MKLKVLYIEDNPINMLLVRKMLRFTDHELIEAEDGATGYAKAVQAVPDIVIMDIGLPDVNGIEIARQMKETPTLKHIPIIALTADVSDETYRACLDVGCAQVLHKPVSRFMLLDTIRGYAEKLGTPGQKDQRAAPAQEKIKVLIAEDNPDLRAIFACTFDRRHFALEAAADGVEAVEHLNNEVPDILILDINMPRMSGYDVLTFVRHNQRTRNMKVIVVTGNNTVLQAPEAEYADLILIKPVNISELITFAQRLIAVPA